MHEIAWLGLMTALAGFILVWKIKIYWFCKYHWQTDVVFGAVSCWLFFGTFSGMATAAVAGVVFSGFLFIAKLIIDV